MTSVLARRGPDGDGIESWPRAALGHRRLSIFDLSNAGRQPMLSPDRRVAVVFNGAIYNFPELRGQLESCGYVFRSRTDTEILVHGFREWGIDGLVPRLRGMYAIGIWDQTTGKLFLVRDRLGIKPLYYSIRNGTLAFASTAAALHYAGFGSELDPLAIADYLEFGYVPDDRCIYQGITKLPAATILEWDRGNVATREHWSPGEPDFQGTFEDAVEETRRLLLQAVKRRLQADVPVGALLSGGIDSSLVCWAIRELGSGITAFTAGTPGDVLDESEDARLTARALGLRHIILDLSGDEFPEAEELVDAYSEPFACSSGLGMLRLSRAVKSCATVLLVGDGGDDVFLGYPEYRYFWNAQRLARVLPRPIAGLWRHARTIVPEMGPLRRGSHFLDYACGGLGALVRVRPGFPSLERQGIAGQRLRDAFVTRRRISPSIDSARSLLPDFLEYERHGRFVGEYMTKVDGATMRYALEARAPFLDADLCDFARSLPHGMRLRRGELKAILREIARRVIGERVARGRKRGFGIPAGRWMLRRWRPKVEDAFRQSRLAGEGWVHAGALCRAWEQAARSGSVPLQLWYLYVLELWFRRQSAASADGAAARVAQPSASL